VDFSIGDDGENQARVDALLREGGLKRGEPFVAVSPEALWETKLWPAGNFAALCDRMVDGLAVRVVLTGLESRTMDAVKSRLQRPVIDLTGRTTLRDLACLYRRASLLVSTDSGPMHIAAAVGTKVIAIFGPTDPLRTGPYGQGHKVIRTGVSCSPCFKKTCPDPVCMTNLGVEEVLQQVKSLGEEIGMSFSYNHRRLIDGDQS
jgi:3-deoxy-D-manno-octulosonic-acid transferase/heptosyltransferase-1